jgi:hypothetical protein
MDFFIRNHERVFNVNTPVDVFDGAPEFIYKVFFVRDSRGDSHESDVHYFTTKTDAEQYYDNVKNTRPNQMVSPYKMIELKVYPTIEDMPTFEILVDHMRLFAQKEKQTNYRLKDTLTPAQKYKLLVKERTNI